MTRTAVIFLVLMPGGAVLLPAQEAPKTGAVEGTVVNSVTGAGVADARILFSTRSNDHRYFAQSDAGGGFRIPNLAPGDYVPVVEKLGFVSAQANEFGGSVIRITAGGDPVRLRFELAPPGVVRGRVINFDGIPAAKVEVALGPRYTRTARTDKDGGFVFERIDAGQHSLAARAKGVWTYFPATVDPAVAESVQVAPGADEGGYEIRLQSAAVHRVRGIVLGPDSKPVPKAVVELLPESGDPGGFKFLRAPDGTTAFAITSYSGVEPVREKPAAAGEDGKFEISSVREGDWALRGESANLSYTAAISVRHDIDDLRIRLEPGFAVHGSVTLEDGSAATGSPLVIVRLISPDGTPDGSGMGVSERGGPLRIGVMRSGGYRIVATAIGGSYYVSSVMVGAVDAASQPALLSPTSGEIRVSLKQGGTIGGSVDKGDGAMVVLVPQSLAPGDVGRMRTCDAGGSFQFAGLAPDDYYLIAVKGFDPRSMSGAERLREMMRDAASVRVDDGTVASAQLKLR